MVSDGSANWDGQLEIPGPVQSCLETLRRSGARALLVGGAVRDGLLSIPTRDFDVATSMAAPDLARLFPQAAGRDLHLGAVSLECEGHDVTMTTFREESNYTDQRHPATVRFVDDPSVDARRRDFTVNAIYFDPWTNEFLDPVGGIKDLREGKLRVIGDPSSRLGEDPLRILRAVRFAARCNLEPEAATMTALRGAAAQLHNVSSERVLAELTASFTGPGRGRALELLVECGAAEHVLPEVAAMLGVPQPERFHPEGNVFVHVCLVLDNVAAGRPELSWAAVLHDVGKAATFERATDRIRFSGHDVLSARIADHVLRRLKAPRELRSTVVEVCRDHIRFASLSSMRPAKRDRWLRSPRFRSHMDFHLADCLGSHGILDVHASAEMFLADLPPEPPPPLCTGADVIALGVAEGPMVGELLRALGGKLEDEGITDREVALQRLQELVRGRFKPGS